MRPEQGNPLDLNNFPGEDSSGAAAAGGGGGGGGGGGYSRKKKNGGGKDESGKIYECRFCSLRFGKSQALGGHMNRHRQERETETLNRARQLVFSNDNLMPPTPPHLVLGGQIPISHGGYHQQTSDPFRTTGYPAARYYCGGSSSSANIPQPPPPPHQSYMYPSPPRLVPYPPPQYNINPPINDYFVGHAVHSTSQLPSYTTPALPENNYTCVGAPVVGHGFKQGGGGGKDQMASSVQNINNNYNTSGNNNNNEVEGEGRSYPNSSMINRYQDGF